MSLNLITDPWIPVVDTSGADRVIAPWQVADPDIARVNWPRADLNIACLELLIGLVFLADPPEDEDDWDERKAPDPDRLRARLAPFAPAFELLGDGPRFMQDIARLEGKPNPPDMLFIDSASNNAISDNKDLMVWRDRYGCLSLPMAAMALYTTQVFAYSDSPKHRASLRGNGPLVTMVDPGHGLWSVIWANVPDGVPVTSANALPWMFKTDEITMRNGVYPEQRHVCEAFFGMPWRMRLVGDNDGVSGFIRVAFGTKYIGWDHPLTPYFWREKSQDWYPMWLRAGYFGYTNWLGVVVDQDRGNAQSRRAQALRNWEVRSDAPARVIVAGWAMNKAKPLDFILSVPPLLPLSRAEAEQVEGLIKAADLLSLALRFALVPLLAEGSAREAVREAFFAQTQARFEALVTAGLSDNTGRAWLDALRDVALRLFEDRALPGLADQTSRKKPEKPMPGDEGRRGQREIVEAHRNLTGAFSGYGKYGRDAFVLLELPVPDQENPTKKKEAAT